MEWVKAGLSEGTREGGRGKCLQGEGAGNHARHIWLHLLLGHREHTLLLNRKRVKKRNEENE